MTALKHDRVYVAADDAYYVYSVNIDSKSRALRTCSVYPEFIVASHAMRLEVDSGIKVYAAALGLSHSEPPGDEALVLTISPGAYDDFAVTAICSMGGRLMIRTSAEVGGLAAFYVWFVSPEGDYTQYIAVGENSIAAAPSALPFYAARGVTLHLDGTLQLNSARSNG